MINALHLLWIIPAAASFGFVVAALMVAAGDQDRFDGLPRDKEQG